MNKDIRWKQRFENFEKAVRQLDKGVERPLKDLSELEQYGVIQSFEFTFELAWKTLKDYLENKGTEAAFPRDVIKSAFQSGLIDDGDAWMDMLEKRNWMAHAYDEKRFHEALSRIFTSYTACLRQVYLRLGKEIK